MGSSDVGELDLSRRYDKRILVVEDEELAQVAALHYLEGLGCRVDFAATGEEALRLALRYNYDLIFMDIGIFDMDGFNIAKRIKSTHGYNRETPIVALTVHVYERLKERAKDLGFMDYISKPLTLVDCHRVLSSV